MRTADRKPIATAIPEGGDLLLFGEGGVSRRAAGTP
jgi:hypothetical protein